MGSDFPEGHAKDASATLATRLLAEHSSSVATAIAVLVGVGASAASTGWLRRDENERASRPQQEELARFKSEATSAAAEREQLRAQLDVVKRDLSNRQTEAEDAMRKLDAVSATAAEAAKRDEQTAILREHLNVSTLEIGRLKAELARAQAACTTKASPTYSAVPVPSPDGEREKK